MDLISILMMIGTFFIIWGGLFFFLGKAYKKEKSG
jgi:hypothetical protein